MSSSRSGLKFWINVWLPVAIGIGIIAIESTAWLGANHTSHPLRVLWEALFGKRPKVPSGVVAGSVADSCRYNEVSTCFQVDTSSTSVW